MSGRRQGNMLPTALAQLQNLIKRDASLYRDEFLQQLRHYASELKIFQLKPTTAAGAAVEAATDANGAVVPTAAVIQSNSNGRSSDSAKHFAEVVMFIAQVSHCFKEETQAFPAEIMDLLAQHGPLLDHDIRMSLCRSLILLRNKDLIPCVNLLELFFQLFRCSDKPLRKLLYTHIVTDVKNINRQHKNNKVNKTLQNFMYSMLADPHPTASKKSLEVMIELYHKNIWNDAKTVNVISTACFSPVTKIMVTAIKFFLGVDQKTEEDEDRDPDDMTVKDVTINNKIAKKTKHRARKLNRALEKAKRKLNSTDRTAAFAFSALHLLNDPQGFSEKLFANLRKSTERYEVKLFMMNLISRLVGVHQLFLLNFYPFMQRYMQPHQKDVTLVLAYVAQASHELVPPDVMEPVIMTLVNQFVNDKSSPEVMAVGLNSVREICVRCPLAMNETLMRDLAMYKTFKDKGVVAAARSLIQFYRVANPALLHRRDRGRPLLGDEVDSDDEQSADDVESADEDVSDDEDGSAMQVDDSDNEADATKSNKKAAAGQSDSEDEDDNDEASLSTMSLARLKRKERRLLQQQKAKEKSERSKSTMQYGQARIASYVPGAELLAADLDMDDIMQGKTHTEEVEGEADEWDGWEEDSDVEDSDEGEWIDVHHSSDEEGDQAAEPKRKLTPEEMELARQKVAERKQKAALLSANRILTPEDYAAIRKKRLEMLANNTINQRRSRKRGHEEVDNSAEAIEERLIEDSGLLSSTAVGAGSMPSETVDPSALEPQFKRYRQDKAERMASIMAGREDRLKYGSRKGKHNNHASTTNKEKAKRKNAMMILHGQGVRSKIKRSFRGPLHCHLSQQGSSQRRGLREFCIHLKLGTE
ncbi:Scad1 protein [Capsaspora owczarzaki ATCC 30864]|uniref:Protein SDA1 n=1 Tax=Capsaspora owczarzaki (strain ATCC 30864) TaxID=595528 RepID=A0A0D2WNU0_CAPO3|nr:Scad1 protein [Capsaspora owczarzaki ATCC 30864]